MNSIYLLAMFFITTAVSAGDNFPRHESMPFEPKLKQEDKVLTPSWESRNKALKLSLQMGNIPKHPFISFKVPGGRLSIENVTKLQLGKTYTLGSTVNQSPESLPGSVYGYVELYEVTKSGEILTTGAGISFRKDLMGNRTIKDYLSELLQKATPIEPGQITFQLEN